MEDEDDFMLIDELIAVTNYVEQLEHDKSAHSAEIELTNPSVSVLEPKHENVGQFVPQMTETPILYCTGEDSLRSLFHKDGFVCNSFANHQVTDLCNIEDLFGMRLSEDALASDEMLSVVFQKARMNIQILDVAARENAKLYDNHCFRKLRHDVTGLLFTLWRMQRRDLLESEPIAAGLHMLDMLLGPIESMAIIKIVHTSCSIEGNESSSPAYHLMHGQLEWRMLRLSIRHEMFKVQAHPLDSLEEEFLKIIQDLTVLSIAKYNRLKRVDMLYSTPFVCTCVKEVWLIVQLQLENVSSDGGFKGFWAYVNETLYRIRDKIDFYDHVRQKSPGVRFSVQHKLSLDNWTDFSIWLICGLAKLHGFDKNGSFQSYTNERIRDNFECMDSLLRDFLNTDPNEDILRVTLYTVLPVLAKWWPPRTDVLLVFWEYFHKKLNSSFFLQGAAPSTLAVINLSVIAYLNQIEQKIDSAAMNPNETSFSLFIFVFGRVLRRLAHCDDSQIKKIFGRITSKFSAPKLMALNETGIHNLASLFLTLALTTNLTETGQRLQTILLQMPLAKLTTARQISLTRAHVAMLVLFARRRINIGPYVAKLLEQLGSIHTQDEGHGAAVRFLADGFVEIFTATEARSRGEHLLFNAWLPRYLSGCATSEQERILRCVNAMLTKSAAVMFALDADEAAQQCVLLGSLYATMLPYVLQAFVKPDASRSTAELAANLCLGCSYAGSAYQFEEVFAQFAEACVSNVQTLAAFLVIVLSSDKQPNVNQTLIIQMWIKCHICSSSASLDMKSLTNIVLNLDEFRTMYTGDASEIIKTRDPLCSFFSEIGQSYQKTNNFNKQNLITAKVHSYLQSYDKYIAAPLENPDNFMKIYSMIAIIILHCASIVYVKGKNACFFNVVMFQHVLPNHLLTGRSQKPQYVQAIHKVWHLLIMGIEKLDFKHDQHLVTVLTNLIEKWIPHFKTIQQKQFTGRPFINCLKECSDHMGGFVLNKISNAFFVLQRRQPHSQVSFVLTIYQDMFNGVKHDRCKLLVLLRGSCATLMEHAMMVDELATSKSSIFEILESIFKCECYQLSSELQNVTQVSLRSITSKHLAYFSSLYFCFMLRIVKINAIAVKGTIEFVRETISNVEIMRGAGRDGKLRNELDKLEGAIQAASI